MSGELRMKRKQTIPSRIRDFLNCCPLWVELSLLIVLVITLVLHVLTYSNYTETKDLTISNYQSTTERILSLEAEDFDEYLNALATFCLQPYYDSTFSRVIDLATPVTSEQLRYIKRQMYYYYYTRSDIGDYEIYLVNHGLVIGKTGNQQHFVDSPGNSKDFSTAIRACQKDARNQYLTTDADGHLCYYHTLVSVSTQEVQAVVRLSLKPKNLKTLKTNHATSHESILLLNNRHALLYRGNNNSSFKFSDVSKALKNKERILCSRDTSYIMTSTTSQVSGITFICLIPEKLINMEIQQLEKNVQINAAVIWLLSLLLIYPFLLLITSPLKRLSLQMAKTGEGDFTTRIHEGGSREICELSNSFNSMVRHIYKLIRKTYVAELNAKDARLAALEAQINPHFLYNTLQAISTEALLNDQMKIHRMITSLASNLRYTIKGSVLVPLSAEMEYVKNYIFLQKMRNEDLFEFHADIDEAAKNCMIPKISIQTLIENSIIHGRNQNDFRIHITLTVKKQADTIVITEEDDGCGIPEDQLEAIQHSFEIQKTTGQDGIGLANLYNRLQILYEKPTNFKIASKEGAYTRITLVLPAAPDHSKDIFKRKE
mgnify:FL=1